MSRLDVGNIGPAHGTFFSLDFFFVFFLREAMATWDLLMERGGSRGDGGVRCGGGGSRGAGEGWGRGAGMSGPRRV